MAYSTAARSPPTCRGSSASQGEQTTSASSGVKLFVVATDLDGGKSTQFGAPGLDHVPISEAVKASAALPGLYPPARIGDRDYVDGAMKKTLHASVALKAGVKLLICINPIVPFDSELAERRRKADTACRPRAHYRAVADLPRAHPLAYASGMDRYATEFPDADVVLFEPAQDDAVMFFANMFSYADRRRLAEHAYRHTLAELRRRADELEPILARHGVELDRAVLEDEKPMPAKSGQTGGLWGSVQPLNRTLDEIERALNRDKPGRAQGGKRYGAKAAPSDA